MYSCFDCGHLDRTRIKDLKTCYNFGCNARGDNGFTCGWVHDYKKPDGD